MNSEGEDFFTKIIQREINRRNANVTSTFKNPKHEKNKLSLKKIKKKKKENSIKVDNLAMTSPKKIKKRKRHSTSIGNIDNNDLIHHADEMYINKNYKCNVCSMSFELQETLNSHKKEVHVKNEKTDTSKNAEVNEELTLLLNIISKKKKKKKKKAKKEQSENENASAIVKDKNQEDCIVDNLALISPKKMKKRKRHHSTCNDRIENDIPIILADKIHINKKYKCNVCSMSFKFLEALNGHIKEVHIKNEKTVTSKNVEYNEELSLFLKTQSKKSKEKKKEKIKVADVLDTLSPKKPKKRKHQSSFEGLENDVSVVLTDEKSIDKIYKCNFCEMSFTHLSALNKHKTEAHIADKDPVTYVNYTSRHEENSEKYSPMFKKIKKKKKKYNEVDNLSMISPKKIKKRKQHSTCEENIDNDVLIHHADELQINTNYKCNDCNMSFELQETLNDHHKEFHVKNAKTVTSKNVEVNEELKLLLNIISKKKKKKKKKVKKEQSENENASAIVKDKNREDCIAAILESTSCPNRAILRKLQHTVFEANLKSKQKNVTTDAAILESAIFPNGFIEDKLQRTVFDEHLKSKQKNVNTDRSTEELHGNKSSLQCSICSKTYSSKSNLRVHSRIHVGEKPYACGFCGRSYTEKGSLTRHYRIHTGEKPYPCHVCGESFAQSTILANHLKIHTGEKPYACDVCGRSFRKNCNLTTHYRTHASGKPFTRLHVGEKPFACEVCGISFVDKGFLTKHRKIHTEEKPYTCDVCGLPFSQLGTLMSHYRTHTGKKPYLFLKSS